MEEGAGGVALQDRASLSWPPDGGGVGDACDNCFLGLTPTQLDGYFACLGVETVAR